MDKSIVCIQDVSAQCSSFKGSGHVRLFFKSRNGLKKKKKKKKKTKSVWLIRIGLN